MDQVCAPLRLVGSRCQNAGGGLDCCGAAMRVGMGIGIAGVGLRPTCASHPNAEHQYQQFPGVPSRVDVAGGLGGDDGRGVTFADASPLELGLFERDAFQSCPGDHPKGLRVVGRQVVEVARKFGDGVRSDGDRTEELRAVGGDDLAEQRFLVAEVRVEALLAGVRRLGDPVDPGAGQAVTGELGARGVKDYVAQFGGISHSEIIAKRTSSFGSFG